MTEQQQMQTISERGVKEEGFQAVQMQRLWLWLRLQIVSAKKQQKLNALKIMQGQTHQA